MKEILLKTLSFIKGTLSSGTAESAKRFFGGIGFICSLVILFISWYADYKHEHVVNQNILDYGYDILYLSVSLIGLETVTNMVGKMGQKTGQNGNGNLNAENPKN